MKVTVLIILLFLVGSCRQQIAVDQLVPVNVELAVNENLSTSGNEGKFCEPYVLERLQSYFELSEIKADQIVNNLKDLGALKTQTRKVTIGKHTVEWIVKAEEKTFNYETFIKINGDLIIPKDKESLNLADDNLRINMDYADEWEQVKLYEMLDRDIITITMSPRTCTGLMCGVGGYLIYDTKTKNQTFFGTYRTDNEAQIYRFTGELEYFVVATRFEGDPHGGHISSVTYELYKLLPDGKFEIVKNKAGKNYFIKHTMHGEDSGKPDAFEHDWIEKIER